MPTLMTMADLVFVPEEKGVTQRVAVMEEPGKLVMRHAKVPVPGPRELRIKVKYNGICGSDLEAFRGSRKPGESRCH